MSADVNVLPIDEGNPRTEDGIRKEGSAFVIEPYSEDGDPNYKFRLDVELLNPTSEPVETRFIIEWNDRSPEHMNDRTYLLLCPSEERWVPYHAWLQGSRVSARIPVPPGRSRLAMHPPYDHKRFLGLLEALRNHPVEIHSIGRSLHGRDIFVVESGDPSARPFVVMARVHPYESIASYLIEGMLRWIAPGGDEVAALLANRRLLFIPMPNPDGVAEGTCKRTVGGMNFATELSFTDAPEAVAVREYLEGEKPRAVFDLHGWMYNRHDFSTDDETRGTNFRKRLLDRTRLFDRPIDMAVGPVPRFGGANHIGGYLAQKMGTSFIDSSWAWYDRTADELRAMGKEMLVAFMAEY